MKIIWRELLFPGAVVVWVVLYWLQLEGAPRAARVVPVGTMILLIVLLLAVVVRDVFGLAGRSRAAARKGDLAPATRLRSCWPEAAYLLLSVLYFLVFRYVGFHVANLMFLALALTVSRNRPLTICIGTLATAGVIYVTATVMQFNLPTPILLR